MRKAVHIFARFAVMLCAIVWFATVAHTVVCHSENAMCGHDGCSESTVCLCLHHMDLAPEAEPILCEDCASPLPVLPADETVLGLLLPCDIFRPPLTNS